MRDPASFFTSRRLGLLRLFSAALAGWSGAFAVAEEGSLGARIYAEKCLLCHQAAGQGAPPIFPPLAGSDWLAAHREGAIKAVCEGLSGPLTVNGQRYENAMPAQVLNDAETAAVLTFIGGSWGNTLAPFTAEEVRAARAKTRFKTFPDLVKAAAFQPLSAAPAGWAVREVAQLPEFCTRLAGDGRGAVFALAQNGGVYRLDAAAGAVVLIIKAADYLDPQRGDLVALGMTLDAEGRLWIVTNQRLAKGAEFVMSEVVIHRALPGADGLPGKPQPWFNTSYPYGIGPFNHGVSHLAFGPDGLLYVNSGSRTDGGEPGKDARFSKAGETEITACLWRLDPRAAEPKIEVLARGIRNAYGFAWDGAGRLFSVTNGPDADAPEEMDFIEPGRHYGFPFQFADWPVKAGAPYPHTPAPPAGVEFALPVQNLGPAAGQGLATFDPHSSPAGMLWCGNDFAEPLRGTFLITRFGNLLKTPADVGFDLLSAEMERAPDGRWQARVTTILAPLGRPIDVLRSGPGRVLVLEYTRPTDFKSGLGWMPGRIIELAPAPPPR